MPRIVDLHPRRAKTPEGIDQDDTNLDDLLAAHWDGEGQWRYDDSAHDNTRRAGFALAALGGYRAVVGDEEPATVIGDLLGDLRHLCDALGLDFEDLVEAGRFHYDAELRGE